MAVEIFNPVREAARERAVKAAADAVAPAVLANRRLSADDFVARGESDELHLTRAVIAAYESSLEDSQLAREILEKLRPNFTDEMLEHWATDPGNDEAAREVRLLARRVLGWPSLEGGER